MAENNNMINNVAEDVIEEIKEKKDHTLLKTIGAFAAGTTFGATCAVVGRKVVDKLTNGQDQLKDEIKETKRQARISKIEANMIAEQEELAKLKAVEEPEESEVKEASKKKTTK